MGYVILKGTLQYSWMKANVCWTTGPQFPVSRGGERQSFPRQIIIAQGRHGGRGWGKQNNVDLWLGLCTAWDKTGPVQRLGAFTVFMGAWGLSCREVFHWTGSWRDSERMILLRTWIWGLRLLVYLIVKCMGPNLLHTGSGKGNYCA